MIDRDKLEKLNIDNLTGLWERMGGKNFPHDALKRCAAWPHRAWMDWDKKVESIPYLEKSLAGLSKNVVVPVWGNEAKPNALEDLLLKRSWAVSFTQVAMVLALDEYNAPESGAMPLQEVKSIDELSRWTAVASESFGYQITQSVISQLMNDDGIKLLYLEREGVMVATALLYKTGDVIGVHQVGVLPSERGQGLAYEVMLQVLDACKVWQGRYVSLQASAMGLSTYQRLGFESQFEIRNYCQIQA